MNTAFKVSVTGRTAPDGEIALLDAISIGSGNGPEFPIQVVQPYPTELKFSSSSRYGVNLPVQGNLKPLEPSTRGFTHG